MSDAKPIILGAARQQDFRDALAEADAAVEGTSSIEDAEHEALLGLADLVRDLLGSNVVHEHKFEGRTLRHAHSGGDRKHGYFEHPEDQLEGNGNG